MEGGPRRLRRRRNQDGSEGGATADTASASETDRLLGSGTESTGPAVEITTRTDKAGKDDDPIQLPQDYTALLSESRAALENSSVQSTIEHPPQQQDQQQLATGPSSNRPSMIGSLPSLNQQPSDQSPLSQNQSTIAPRTTTAAAINQQGPTALPPPTRQQDIDGQHRRTTTCLESLNNPFCRGLDRINRFFGLGYEVEKFTRRVTIETANPHFNLATEALYHHVGLNIHSIHTYKEHLVGLVKPYIRIHCLHIETGFYLLTRDGRPLAPVTLKALIYQDNITSLHWDVQLLFPELDYLDVIAEKTLFLFELLDEQPSLSLRQGSSGSSSSSSSNRRPVSILRRVAWAYLLPIGVDGQLNAGVPSRQKQSTIAPGQQQQQQQRQRQEMMTLRLQLHEYRHYDGLLGYLQRSALQWPRLAAEYPHNRSHNQQQQQQQKMPLHVQPQQHHQHGSGPLLHRQAMMGYTGGGIAFHSNNAPIQQPPISTAAPLSPGSNNQQPQGAAPPSGIGNIASPRPSPPPPPQGRNLLPATGITSNNSSPRVGNGGVGGAGNGSSSSDSITGIPPIYLQWKIRGKKLIQHCFLKIALGCIDSQLSLMQPPEEGNSAKKKLGDEDNDGSDTNSERSPRDGDGGEGTGEGGHHGHGREDEEDAAHRKKRRGKLSKEEKHKLKSLAMKRTRYGSGGSGGGGSQQQLQESCLVPDQFFNRMEIGPEGAMVVKYSHSGHLLAIAARAASSSINTSSLYVLQPQEVVYSLLLYDTDLDEEVWYEESAHHGVIYDLQWSKNDRYLLTCSGDGTSKVWDFVALSPFMTANPAHLLSHHHGHRHHNQQQHPVADPASAEGGDTARQQQQQQQPPMLKPSRVWKYYPPKMIALLPLPASIYGYCGVFQELSITNPSLQLDIYQPGMVFTDLTTWQEHMIALIQSSVPRIILGASDGKLRVYSEISVQFLGYIMVRDNKKDAEHQDFSPHDGHIHALAIDERSKYLISADSVGDVLIWKQDVQGWYQLLRKLRKDTASTAAAATAVNKAGTSKVTPSSNSNNNSSSFKDGSILSIAIHPEKLKGLMLVLSRQPASLKVMNMATYKPLHYCEKFTGCHAYLVREENIAYSTGTFYRASFSADGRYIICCVNANSSSGGGSGGGGGGGSMRDQEKDKAIYKLLVWNTYTGQLINTPLSKLTFAYPIRSISWHPHQHLLAISMVGPGAAVLLYCTERRDMSSGQMMDTKVPAATATFSASAALSASGSGAIYPVNPANSGIPPSFDRSLLQSQDRSLASTWNNNINSNNSNSNNNSDLNNSLLNDSLLQPRYRTAAGGRGFNNTDQVNFGTLTRPSQQDNRFSHVPMENFEVSQSMDGMLNQGPRVLVAPSFSSVPSPMPATANLSTVSEEVDHRGRTAPPVNMPPSRGGNNNNSNMTAPPIRSEPMSEQEERLMRTARAREILANARLKKQGKENAPTG